MLNFEHEKTLLESFLIERCSFVSTDVPTTIWHSRGKIKNDRDVAIEARNGVGGSLKFLISCDAGTEDDYQPPQWAERRTNNEGHTSRPPRKILNGPNLFFEVRTERDMAELKSYLERMSVPHTPPLFAEDGDTRNPQPDEDSRAVALRQIRIRRGQTDFRRMLIERYEKKCLISGCELLHVLEAAHIKPYRGMPDNDVKNGLLLRSDLHTLFDLDLLGVEPDTLLVDLHVDLLAFEEYAHFKGQRLKCGVVRPSNAMLQLRWADFQKTKRSSTYSVHLQSR